MTSPPDLQRLFADAVLHHQSGRLAEAETLYRQILASDGRHADSLHFLGLIALQQGRHDVAAERIAEAIRSQGDVAAYHSNLGIVLMRQGQLAAAQAQFQRALTLSPAYAEASYNLALALEGQGRPEEAKPHYARTHALKPDFAQTMFNQAVALQRQGRNADAELLYQRTLALDPAHVDARNNLGAALQNLGRVDEAVVQYRHVLALDPANANAVNNLASALQRRGDMAGAMAMALRALELRDQPKTRRILIECLKRVGPAEIDDSVRALMRRALGEVWARPAELAPAVIGAIRQGAGVARCLGQAARPSLADLASIADDVLVASLLRSAPVCDPQLERLFTACRATLLDEVSRDPAAAFTAPVLELACAIAEQCFVNEYVFACSADEARLVQDLETRVLTRLREGGPVPAAWLAALAAYKPLVSLQGAERLGEYPEPVASLIKLQVREPLEERQYQGEIESLTPIRNEVSALVRAQYEENPYPRWLKLPLAAPVQSIDEAFVANFPNASFRPLGPRRPDILIAGCGTGQHSISTARLYPSANVLAVDLSRASLAYALRKSRELGVRNVEYAQADILELGGIGRQFDLIESSGVLHHLGDPSAGLEVLVSLLRPNGLMKLALYSELARQPVVEIRRLIAAQGYAADARGISRCRQDILALAGDDPRRKVLTFNDFYSMSECRDLLFHAQEHRLTLPVIAGWLERLGLRFVTFDVSFEIERTFGWRFLDPSARTDLGSWHLYERDNPNTFVGMYQFWVQKADGAD